MQGRECSKGMSKSEDYRIFSQGRQGIGMEQGRLGRVGHTEFREQVKGLKLEWRIEKSWIQSKGPGNEHGTKGNRDWSSSMGLHRV